MRNPSQITLLISLFFATVYPLTLSTEGSRVLSVYAVYFMWISLAESWNLVGGYAGLLNLGISAFFALGGVVGALALFDGFPFIISLLLAGFAGAILGVALIPTFRLKSFYFAIATLVVPLIVKPMVEFLGNRADFTVPQTVILTPIGLYYSGLVLAGITIFGTYLLMQSRVGFALRALGENELGSSGLVVNAFLCHSVTAA